MITTEHAYWMHSRYGMRWPCVIHLDTNTNTLYALVSFPGALSMRTGEKDGEVTFIDPDGGPFIDIGANIEVGDNNQWREVTKITLGNDGWYTLELN